jgi:hypothetical protein
MYKVFAKDCEDTTELIKWAIGHLPNALVVETEGEILIQTGIAVGEGNTLTAIKREED